MPVLNVNLTPALTPPLTAGSCPGRAAAARWRRPGWPRWACWWRGPAHGGLAPLFGGWHWQSLTFAVLQGMVAVTFSLWVLGWFGRRWTGQGRLAVRAGRGAYAAYVLHAPVLVLVSLAARPLPLPLEAKFVLVAAAGVVAAFSVGWAVTRSALVARFV